MSIVPVLIAIVLAVLVAAFLRGRDRPRPPRVDPSTETEQDVHRLLTAGRKIEAIKLYRRLHGVGLKEAKEAVERMQAGEPVGAATPSGTGRGPGSDDEVRRHLDAGRKIEAIKAYRELYGVGLKEAKEAVERMQR